MDASNAIMPPLPEGFTLDSTSGGLPPLPDGFTLDTPSSGSSATQSRVTGIDQPEPFSQAYKQNVGQYGQDITQQVTKPFKQDTTAGPEWLQRIGDIGSRVASVPSDVIGAAVAAPITAGLETQVTQPIARQFVTPQTTLAQKQALAQTAKDTADLGTQAVLMPTALKANEAPAEISSAMQGLEGLADQYAAKYPVGTLPEEIPPAPPPMEYDPITTHSAISDAYGAAKAATRPYYNLMKDIGAGETADASDLKPALDSMISDIQNTPFHEATSELPYLKQQAAKISEDGTMPLNDMVKLKQNLNSNFNPKRFAQGADTPYSTVGGIVDDSLEDAANRIPEFGEAKSLADKNWLNTVKAPFEDNKVLQKFWKPEDYYAKQSVDNGMLEELPDPTLERANSMLANVKTPTQLNAIRRALPDDLADAFSQAKIDNLQAGKGKLADIGKAAYNAGNMQFSSAAKNIKDIFSSSYTPQEQALLDAAKTPSPTLSTKYQKPYADLKASIQQQQDLADEMQPYGQNIPRTAAQKESDLIGALPTPDEIAAARQAGMSPAGYAAMRQQQLKRQYIAANTGTPNSLGGELANQLIGIGLERQAARAKTAPYFDEIQNPKIPLKSMVAEERHPEDVGEVGRALKAALGLPYKRGGAVQPTEAMKKAGNYKKQHIRLHGLDISIENPKGSIRSGKDKNGKAWECKMPCAYGYIKGTESKDGDHLDCFIGPNPKSLRVYVIDQKNDNGTFDESKVMIGFKDRESALKAYRNSYSDRKNRIMHIKKMLISQFKEWLANGNTKKPIKEAA